MHRRPRPSWLSKTTTSIVARARRLDQSVRPVILDASGLTLIAVAAFHLPGVFGSVAGYAVSGLACFALQRWRKVSG